MPSENPLKVVIVSPTFGAYGGIEAFVLAIARYLKTEPTLEVRLVWKKVAGFTPTEALEKAVRGDGHRLRVCGERELGTLAATEVG